MLQALSVCLIAKNEEHSIPRCLDSVRDLAGEIIVIDTGSTDSTAQVAAQPWRTSTAVRFYIRGLFGGAKLCDNACQRRLDTDAGCG